MQLRQSGITAGTRPGVLTVVGQVGAPEHINGARLFRAFVRPGPQDSGTRITIAMRHEHLLAGRHRLGLLLIATLVSSCGNERRNEAAPGRCQVTPPNGNIPPGQHGNPGADRAPYFGNDRLGTVLYPNGIVRETPGRDGSVAQKFPWWRGVRGHLKITDQRLDATAPPLRARIPAGYGPTGFQATALVFPTQGCWRVQATAGAASLSFVTRVAAATAG